MYVLSNTNHLTFFINICACQKYAFGGDRAAGIGGRGADFCEIGTYTREVTNDSWGMLCLPLEGVKIEGDEYYDVLGTKDPTLGVALAEVEVFDNLTAGKPYVFKATSNQIKVTYYPETAVATEVPGNNIIGSFAGCTVPQGKYIINGQFVIIHNSKTYNALGF